MLDVDILAELARPTAGGKAPSHVGRNVSRVSVNHEDVTDFRNSVHSSGGCSVAQGGKRFNEGREGFRDWHSRWPVGKGGKRPPPSAGFTSRPRNAVITSVCGGGDSVVLRVQVRKSSRQDPPARSGNIPMKAPPAQPGLGHTFNISCILWSDRVGSGDGAQCPEPMAWGGAEAVEDERDSPVPHSDDLLVMRIEDDLCERG